MIWCDHCQKMMKIKSWQQDNPILSCNHVKIRTPDDDIVDRLRELLGDLGIWSRTQAEKLMKQGYSREQANIKVATEYSENQLDGDTIRAQIRNSFRRKKS